MSPRVKAPLALATLAILLVLAGLFPAKDWLQGFTAWVGGAGTPGVLVFAGVYVVLVGIGFPALPLTLAAGVLYGPLLGTLVVSPSSTLGAFMAFKLGKGFFRDWVRRKAREDPRLGALDAAVGREGWRLVALLRLSPVFPFNLVNLALGSTGIRTIPYVLASWLAMLPGTFLFVSLGAAAGQASGLTHGHAARPWMLGVGIAATALLTFRITQIARRALAKRLPGSEPA